MAENILLVDDDAAIAQVVEIHINNIGYTLVHCLDGEEGLERALNEPFAAVILDWNLPKIEGIEICRRLRQENPQVPVMMLTSRGDEIDRVLGLEIGADDYLSKPFSARELSARLKSLLRRAALIAQAAQPSKEKPISLGGVQIDAARRTVKRDGTDIPLTFKEFELLHFLASRPGRVFSRDELLEAVWEYSGYGYEPVVTSFISRLRSKLETDASEPVYIVTVRGAGYKFALPSE